MIENTDCLTFLKSKKDKSANLFILDPPYYKVVKSKWDNQWKTMEEYLSWCDGWLKEVGRVSKYSGSMWLFGFPYQLVSLIPIVEKCGFSYRQQIIIWKGMKSAAGRTSSKLKMYPTTTESIFFFSYDSIFYIKTLLNEQKNKRKLSSKELNEYLGKASNGGGTWSTIAGIEQKTPCQPTEEDWNKLNVLFNGELPPYKDLVFPFNLQKGLTDVWDDINFYNDENRFHETQKPEKLIKRIINSSSNEGDLIVDPFMGSGTTAICCEDLNRLWEGCELDKKYIKLANNRIKSKNNTEKFIIIPK
jgi:DNA modification methylase